MQSRNLSFVTFPHDHPQPGPLASQRFNPYLNRKKYKAILQHHAPLPGCQLLRVRSPGKKDLVFFFMTVPRVGKTVGQIAVVCEQDQAFTIGIQATYRISVPPTGTRSRTLGRGSGEETAEITPLGLYRAM